MNDLTRIAAILTLLGILTGCAGRKGSGIPAWTWTDPDTPAATTKAEKPRYVWIDAPANFSDYASDRNRIRTDLGRLRRTGFTDIVVDVRPVSGRVLFRTDAEKPLEKVDAWQDGSYLWVKRSADFDYLQAFIEEGHAAGLHVHASVNTFVGGWSCAIGRDGMLFDDASKRSWATVINTADGLRNTLDLPDEGVKFLNPAHPDVQAFVLGMLEDLAAYDVDGIILDRCRYDDYGLMCDFSDVSRTQFEAFTGQAVSRFPEDIFARGQAEASAFTALQKQWLAFRAKVIHDFIVRAGKTVHGVNPDIRFGVYAGAWYSDYYRSGVNWASPKYDPAGRYPWASRDYRDYGFADQLDYLFLGAYAAATSIFGTSEWTMQGFAAQGASLLRGNVPFACGPDIGNPEGWEHGGQAARIPDTIKACIGSSDGYFVFDLCHIKMYDYWDAFRQGIDQYLTTLEQ